MNFRRFKHMLVRLSIEEKVIAIGLLASLVGSFFPWYWEKRSSQDPGIIHSGLSGDLGVIGFVAFLLSALGLLYVMGDYLGLRLPRFGRKKQSIVFFFAGQSAFMLLLTMAVYLKRSLDVTQAGLRFGIFFSFVGAFFAAFAAFAALQKSSKKETQSFFGYEPEQEAEQEPSTEPSEEEGQISLAYQAEAQHASMTPGEDGSQSAHEELPENPTSADPGSEPESQRNYPDQGSFFTRDANR